MVRSVSSKGSIVGQFIREALNQKDLGSNPDPTTYILCNTGQVT